MKKDENHEKTLRNLLEGPLTSSHLLDRGQCNGSNLACRSRSRQPSAVSHQPKTHFYVLAQTNGLQEKPIHMGLFRFHVCDFTADVPSC